MKPASKAAWRAWARGQKRLKWSAARMADPWHRWAYNSARYGRRRGMKGVTAKDFYELAQRAGFQCQVTGLELEPEVASLDHIKAVRRGGPDTLSNLQLVHREVNRIKGTLTMRELRKWCRLILGEE